MNNTSELWMCF